MAKSYFITGTDTGVGKTWVSVALMRYFRNQGKSVAAMKPVASGGIWQNGQLVNNDALLLQQNASRKIQYDMVNLFVFEEPVSPHIAAKKHGVTICFDRIVDNLTQLQQLFEIVIVEGVGGWYVPLGEQIDIESLAVRLEISVIVVVAIKLGCINHARLTFAAINNADVPIAGWIANCVEPNMMAQQENILTIADSVPEPLLAVLPYFRGHNFDDFAGDFSSLD